MAVTAINVNDREVRIGLGELRAAVANPAPLLTIVGVLMRASVARTFRDEGSPAGSWPRLAASTLRNKKYRGGHKLLILSGRLFSSINYAVAGNTLTIGTNVVYARVQQEGSADRAGGSIGAQARIDVRSVKVSAYSYLMTRRRKAGDKFGKIDRFTPEGFRIKGKRRKLVSGIAPGRTVVEGHHRFQNIPARPFLVIRPEDPARIVSGIEAYLGVKAVRLGKVGGK